MSDSEKHNGYVVIVPPPANSAVEPPRRKSVGAMLVLAGMAVAIIGYLLPADFFPEPGKLFPEPVAEKVIPETPTLPSYDFPPIGGPIPDGPLWEVVGREPVTDRRGQVTPNQYNFRYKPVSLKEARGKWLVLFFENNAGIRPGDKWYRRNRMTDRYYYGYALELVVKHLHEAGVPIQIWQVKTSMIEPAVVYNNTTVRSFSYREYDPVMKKYGIEFPWSRHIIAAAKPGADGSYVGDIARWHLKNISFPYIDHYTAELPKEDGDRPWRVEQLLKQFEDRIDMPFAILDPEGRLRFTPDWAYCRDVSSEENGLLWPAPHELHIGGYSMGYKTDVQPRCADVDRVGSDMTNLGIVTRILFTLTGQPIPDSLEDTFRHGRRWGVHFPEPSVPGNPDVLLTQFQNCDKEQRPRVCREWQKNYSAAKGAMSITERTEFESYYDYWRDQNNEAQNLAVFAPHLEYLPGYTVLPQEVRLMRQWTDLKKEMLGALQTH